MMPTETYLPKIQLSPLNGRVLSCSETGQHPQLVTGIERSPLVTVPRYWKEVLPHEQFATVLPMSEAADFRTLCQTASFTERPDGNFDVIGVLRHKSFRPVWLTAIKYPRLAIGYLDFGSNNQINSKPNILFSILYGHPDTVGFDWESLFETLELQFRENGLDKKMRRNMVKAWHPHLRPLAKVMDNLETSASAVILTGENRHRGTLSNLGINTFPVLTPMTTKVLDMIWPSIQYVVQESGWFAKINLNE